MITPQKFKFRFEFATKEMAETAMSQLLMQKFTNELAWCDKCQKWVCTSTLLVDRRATPVEKVHAYLYTLIEACDGVYRSHELIDDDEKTLP